MNEYVSIDRQEDSYIIDAHTHLGLEKFIVSQIPEEKRKLPAFQERQENRLDELMAAMDRNGVIRAVSFPFPLAEIDQVVANQYVLDAHRTHPTRIIPFALLGDDVDRWLKEGAMGFKQHPLLSPERFDLGHIYPCLAEARVPLIAHLSSARGVSVTEQVKCILRMAPRLKVIVAHMGRRIPNTGEGVEENLLGLQHEERVYFETSTVRSPKAIARAVDLLGEERVLFGSDNPFGSCDSSDPLRDEIATVRRAGLTDKALQRVLGENLLACLGVRYSLVDMVANDGLSNGCLIDSSLITFTEEEVAAWEEGSPEIRAVLQRVEIRTITYMSGELQVTGIRAAPKEGKVFPCLIYNRGGNREFGAVTKEQAALFIGRVASWGYVVVASQYRGNMGGEGREEFGGADVDDVLNLIPLLGSFPQADTSRIGMYGRSRGGMMTYIALTKTDRIAAAIVDAGEANLFLSARRRLDMEEGVFKELIPGYTEHRIEALTARSAIRWPERLCKSTPILLLHGSADWRVHPMQALGMAAALYRCRHPFRLVLFEGGDHGLSEHREEVFRLIKDWLNHYVRDRKAWPSLDPHGR